MFSRVAPVLILAANTIVIALPGVVCIPSFGLAQNAHAKAEPAQTARRLPPPAGLRPFGIIRQDLFDRNNPNNLRSDYSAPPAQPGSF